MIIFPAIDIYDGKAVRLLRGSYNDVTVYSDDPVSLAKSIEEKGATHLHVVDLAGAKDGALQVLPLLKRICQETNLRVEIGGGIRSFDAIEACLDAGAFRVILGTKALTDAAFLDEALSRFGNRIAVGVDAKDGFVAIKGWTEVSDMPMERFLADLKARGASCAIVTDIAKDGAMQGTNLALYETLVKAGLQNGPENSSGADAASEDGSGANAADTAHTDGNHSGGMQLVASGGVSSLDDLRALSRIGVSGAILGKAMYTGAVKLEDALNL